MLSKPYVAPLFVDPNLWSYIEGVGTSKYCNIFELVKYTEMIKMI
jgi:hypothetical protein